MTPPVMPGLPPPPMTPGARSISDLYFQPDLDIPFAGWGMRLRFTGADLVEARGLGGITQPEPDVPLPDADPAVLDWRSFRWMHYTVGLARLHAGPRAIVTFAGDGHETGMPLEDLRGPARRIELSTGCAVFARVGGVVEVPVSFTITPSTVAAGSRAVFRIECRIGGGIPEHGGLRVFTPYSSWSAPDPDAMECEAVGPDGSPAGCDVVARIRPYAHPAFGHVFEVRVARGRLRAGDRVRWTYRGADTGVVVQAYPKSAVPFAAFVDGCGDGFYLPVPPGRAPTVRIVAGAPARLRLAMPMVVAPNEESVARAVVLDDERNPVVEPGARPMTLEIVSGAGKTVSTTRADAVDGRVEFSPAFVSREGWYRVTVRSPGLLPATLSIRCRRETPSAPGRLYWGAIHGHTEVSDGEFPPEDYYPYGRDTGLVDFCAMTDHDWEIVEHDRNRRRGGFARIVDLARRWNEPGRFVTFSAYEWMGPDGHVNVYHLHDDPDAAVWVGNVSFTGRTGAADLRELLGRYRGRDDVLLIPHSSHGQLWRTHDDDLMPVVEMYSCWGCSETDPIGPIGTGARDALRRGHRLGFIGGADSHHGSPGHTGAPSKYHLLPCREGFAAVYAEDLTRQALFAALRARRCYATTAERIVLEFSVNGRPMGSLFDLRAGAPCEIRCEVGGTDRIRSIELLRDGAVIDSASGGGHAAAARWDAVVEPGVHDYSVRVTQRDGEAAWSSPVWIRTGNA